MYDFPESILNDFWSAELWKPIVVCLDDFELHFILYKPLVWKFTGCSDEIGTHQSVAQAQETRGCL